MFTGIITDVGRVRTVAEANGGRRLEIATAYPLSEVALGASIACSGVCLSVVEKGDETFAVEVSRETLSKTTLGVWVEGRLVNLERALKLGDEFGGHIVAGHVDGVGQVVRALSDGDSLRVQVRAPDPLHRFIASKGSVTIDGVSLTVNEVEGEVFGVNLIPLTRTMTTLGDLRSGDRVNLEIDLLARYAARWQETA
ncbi:MAG: riboflavin synthase [Proteobacteria bacterium]|nr:riboflavin synthase [Pseudomonadota bacterium]